MYRAISNRSARRVFTERNSRLVLSKDTRFLTFLLRRMQGTDDHIQPYIYEIEQENGGIKRFRLSHGIIPKTMRITRFADREEIQLPFYRLIGNGWRAASDRDGAPRGWIDSYKFLQMLTDTDLFTTIIDYSIYLSRGADARQELARWERANELGFGDDSDTDTITIDMTTSRSRSRSRQTARSKIKRKKKRSNQRKKNLI